MSSFQDDKNGHDTTRLYESEAGDDDVEVFTEDVEGELMGLLTGLEAEAADPDNAKTALLTTDSGRVANSYLTFWLTCLQADHNQELEPKTTLAELLLFLALKQADMDLAVMGKVN